MPRVAAASLALARLRDAMATTLVYWPRCMAGMTFLRPMSAVLRTPQRSLLGMVVMIKELKGKEEQRITIPGTHPSSASGNEADSVWRVAVLSCQASRPAQSTQQASVGVSGKAEGQLQLHSQAGSSPPE